MRKQDNKKKITPGSIIALVVALAFIDSDLFAIVLTLAILIGPIILIIYLARKSRNPSKKSNPSRPMTKQQSFPLDDCPKTFCFHKDKGEHHVRKGKEIDPWDRPDIDISKYQRRQ